MEYRDHPLLEGFRDKPDLELLDCAIAALEYAAWVSKGAKFDEKGLPDGVEAAIREGFTGMPRAGLEKFLYHAIVAQVVADREARHGKSSSVPST